MNSSFPGLSEADFEAYLPARATSNAFVRARLPVKEKLLALGRELAEQAVASGVALDVQGSDERPSVWNKKSVTGQWIFLWRDREARAELERAAESSEGLSATLMDPTPFYKHAFLALFLDSEHFEVSFRVHREAWADVKNIRARLATEVGRSSVASAFAGLPSGFVVGVASHEERGAGGISADAIGALLDTAVEKASWLHVSWSVSRADACAAGSALGPSVHGRFSALLPVYRSIAWRRDDDSAAIGEELARGRAAREAHVAEVAAREAERQALQDAEIQRQQERALSEARERVVAIEPIKPAGGAVARGPRSTPTVEPALAKQKAAAPEPAVSTKKADGPRARVKPPQPAKDAPRAKDPLRANAEWVDSGGPVIAGARVRIATGPLAGKIGTVTELDPKGVAKVSLGLLSARVESRELVALAEKR